MEEIRNTFNSNKEWLYSIIGGIGAVIAWYVNLRRQNSRKSSETRNINTTEIQNTPKTNVVINNNITSSPPAIAEPTAATKPESNTTPPTGHQPTSKTTSDEAIKERTTILFIDDDREFKIVSMLKKAGWKRVSIIEDVDRVDAEKIRIADIIFVDIQGVGKRLEFAREGLGLMKAIKERYPKKKVVIYSAVPTHDIFSEELAFADARLRKSAEFIEFEKTIEDLL